MPNIIKWAEQKLRGKPKVTVVRRKIQDPREEKVRVVPKVKPKVPPKVPPKGVLKTEPGAMDDPAMKRVLNRREELRKIMEET